MRSIILLFVLAHLVGCSQAVPDQTQNPDQAEDSQQTDDSQQTEARAEPVEEQAAQPSAPSTSGTARLGEKVLNLTSSAAVWLPSKRELEFLLFPFELSDEDIETARTKGGIFVIFGKPSPAPESWPDWSPFVTIKVEVAENAEDLSRENIKSVNVNIAWLREKNHAFFANYPNDWVEEGAFQGKIKAGERVNFRIKGEISGSDVAVPYDLSADADVLVCGPPRCPNP